LRVDEKLRIQAIGRTAPVRPMRPAGPERMSHAYRRHGTTDLLAALDVRTGTVIARCQRRHRSCEFRGCLDEVETAVPDDLEVHLILDSLQAHKEPLLHAWLVKRPRCHLRFTPTCASWLDLVEGWLALLTRRRLERGVFTSTEDLEAAIRSYVEQTSAEPKPFVWTKPADQIIRSVGRFCKRTSASDH
jgi:hypothetical protein